MADEHDIHEDTTSAPDTGETAGTEPAASQDAPPLDERGDTYDDDAYGGFERGNDQSLPNRNREVLGRLIAHFGERDVVAIVDGDAAIRMIAAFDGDREHLDVAHPNLASAHNGYFGASMSKMLAITWLPGVPEPDRGTAVVDPA